MLLIGSHVGFNKATQMLGSLEEALSYGANTFMRKKSSFMLHILLIYVMKKSLIFQ